MKYANPAGLAQTIQTGSLYVLPREWSDATTKISDLIKQVVQNYMGDLPIGQDVSRIDDSPGLLTGAVLDLDGVSISDFFEDMRQATGQDWYLYVDFDSTVVFTEKSQEIVDTVIVGYDWHQVDEKSDDSVVVNRWYIQRKNDKFEGAGFKSGAIVEDATSIANYGLMEQTQEVGASYGDALCLEIGNTFLAQSKDARLTVSVKNAPYQYYPIGLWRIIGQPRERETVVSECENLTGWSHDTGITLSNSSDSIVGAYCVQALYGAAENGKWFKLTLPDALLLSEPKEVRFWFKGARIGQMLKVGLGKTSPTEHTSDLYVYKTQWDSYPVPLAPLGLSQLGVIGFQVNDAVNGSSFLIDQITIVMSSSEHLVMELVEVKLSRGATKSAQLTFGVRVEELGRFMAGQLASLKTARLALST